MAIKKDKSDPAELDSIGRRKSPLVNNRTIIVRLPADVHDKIKSHASRKNQTVSILVRNLLSNFSARHKL